MRRWMGALVAVGLVACGSGAAQTTATATSGAGGASTTASATSAGGATLNGGASCTPPCAPPKTCSVSATCIDPGACAASGDCKTGGTVCDPATKTCVPGGCKAQKIPATPVEPNLLIVLDRSCSMTNVVTGKLTKWDIAVAAIDKLTADYATRIRFGLTLFPDLDADKCAQGPIPIPVGPANAATIQAMLTASLKQSDPLFPKGPCVTPIDTGVGQALTDPALMDKARASYVMLLTDGMQSAGCKDSGGNAGTLKTVTALKAAGVGTFAVGFGNGVDVKHMNEWATAGGEANPMGPNAFYDASDQASLDAAFAIIAARTISCDFKLASTPADVMKIYAFLDKVSVAQDKTHAGGWDYDAKTNVVTFYGASCDDLKSGKVKLVDVVYGCDQLPM